MKRSTIFGLILFFLGCVLSVGWTAGCRSGPGVDLAVQVPGMGTVGFHSTPFGVVPALTDALGVTTPPAEPTPSPISVTTSPAK